MGFIKDQMSKVVDKQIADSKLNKELKTRLSTMREEASLERRMQLGQQLSESYLIRLDACIEQAEAKAKEIQEMEIPQTAEDYIAFVKLCKKKVCAPLLDAFEIEDNESIKIEKKHFDTKQPDKIIKKAWDDKFIEAVDMGEISFATNPAVCDFLKKTTQQVKKYRQKEKVKKMLSSDVAKLLIYAIVMLFILFAVARCAN